MTPCRSSAAVNLSNVDCTEVGYSSPWASQFPYVTRSNTGLPAPRPTVHATVVLPNQTMHAAVVS